MLHPSLPCHPWEDSGDKGRPHLGSSHSEGGVGEGHRNPTRTAGKRQAGVLIFAVSKLPVGSWAGLSGSREEGRSCPVFGPLSAQQGASAPWQPPRERPSPAVKLQEQAQGLERAALIHLLNCVLLFFQVLPLIELPGDALVKGARNRSLLETPLDSW